MAYEEVTEDNVYLCVGHPPRRDIENIVKWMLNDHFSVAYNSILYSFHFDYELLTLTSLCVLLVSVCVCLSVCLHAKN